MTKFLNLKNCEISTNTYRFPEAQVTTHEDLMKAWSENSNECLVASFDEKFFLENFKERTRNTDYSNMTRKEISEYVDEMLGVVARDLLLEWDDFCDEINELRADLEYEAFSQIEE